MAVEPGGPGHFRVVNPGSGGDFLRIQVVQVVIEGSRILAVILDPLFVDQFLGQQFPQQAAQQQQLAAGNRPQPAVGVAGQFHFPGVNDDQRRAGFHRPLKGDAGHIVILGQVAVKDQDSGGLFQLPDRISGRAVAQGLLQAGAQFRLQVGSQVHIVGLHGRSRKLLGQVKLLSSAVGGGQQAKGRAAIFGQPLGNVIQGIVPGGGGQLPLPAD